MSELCCLRQGSQSSCRGTAQELNQSPTPPTEIVWGDPAALLANEIAALWDPAEIGLNTIETEQLAPGAKLLPQLFV